MSSVITKPQEKSASRTLRDTSGYMAGQLALLLMGFATFPVFTRGLSKADYGNLSLINTSLSILLLVLGLGLPNAVVRFLPEYSLVDAEAGRRFNTTQLFGSILSASTGCALLVATSFLVHPGTLSQSFLIGFRYVAFVLVSRAAMNILLEVFRVGRHVALYNGLTLAQRIANCGGSVAGFLMFHSLNGVLGGMVWGETLVALVAALLSYRFGYVALTALDRAQLRESLRFAAPLMFASVAGSMMSYADRYMIQAYLGSEAVATYGVAYDLCGYVQALLLVSFRLGVLPELVSKYAKLGADAASEYLSRSFRLIGWLVIGSAFGFAAVGGQVVTTLASSKYAEAGALLPYLIPGVTLGGLDFVFASGLYLRKRNDLWFYIAASGALLNVGLNVVMIPAYGMKGAAYATFLAYLAQEIAVCSVSNRFVKLRLDVGSLLRAACCGVIMFVLVKRMNLPIGGIAGMAVTAASGAVAFGLLHLAVERDSRQLLWGSRG